MWYKEIRILHAYIIKIFFRRNWKIYINRIYSGVAVDAELKDIITSKWGSYTDKYKTRVESDNIINIRITTNNNWKGAHGDSSSKYMDDQIYFENLKKCFNDLVGKAIFSYLQEIDVSEFNSAIMPQTKNKLDLIAEQLLPIISVESLKKLLIRENGFMNLIQLKIMILKHV